jgi:hypothetical protein
MTDQCDACGGEVHGPVAVVRNQAALDQGLAGAVRAAML